MERSFLVVLAIGVVAAAGLALISPYLSLIALIIVGVVLMVQKIGSDTHDLPDLQVEFSEDARAVIVENKGNAPAHGIHLSLVPIGVEADVPSLAPDAMHPVPLAEQVAEVKAIVTYRNGQGQEFRRSMVISALHSTGDLLRPSFALFRWK
ncbi:MAG: hypothetical protein AB7S61_03150 [Methanoregulaceae archaeon]